MRPPRIELPDGIAAAKRSIFARAPNAGVSSRAANEILLAGEIGFDVTLSAVREQLRLVSGPVDVLINSPGGDAFEGIAIYNVLRDHTPKVTVKVIGLAASAASIIAMAGDEIKVGLGSTIMIHNSWALAVGDADGHRETAELLDRIDGSVAQIYAERSGQTIAEVRSAMAATTWMNAEEAIEFGFADSSSGERGQPAAQWDLSIFNNVPDGLRHASREQTTFNSAIDLERFLHRAGLSRSQAARVAPVGYSALNKISDEDEKMQRLAARLAEFNTQIANRRTN